MLPEAGTRHMSVPPVDKVNRDALCHATALSRTEDKTSAYSMADNSPCRACVIAPCSELHRVHDGVEIQAVAQFQKVVAQRGNVNF